MLANVALAAAAVANDDDDDVVSAAAAAAVPSQAVVSTVKGPFLSWHLDVLVPPHQSQRFFYLFLFLYLFFSECDKGNFPSKNIPAKQALHRPTLNLALPQLRVAHLAVILQQTKELAIPK